VKPPVFFAGAGKGLRALMERVSRLSGGLLEASRRVAVRVGAGIGRMLGNRTARMAVVIGGGMVAVLVLAILGAMMVGGLRSVKPVRAGVSTAAERGTAMRSPSLSSGTIPAMPRSGPALASMLLIPGQGEWPYPLALEPKSRYTEDDAAPLRPDLAEVDVSGLIRRRKAELEVMYGSVD
jgi:hypothetical protein